MLALEVIEGPDAGRRFPLPPGEPQLLGRSSEAMPLSDRSISRRHAELTPDGDRWVLRDLDSANGTEINGGRVAAATPIGVGDTIRCGHTCLQVIDAGEMMAGPARNTAGLKQAPPPMLLPPDPEDQQRLLAMLWTIASHDADAAGQVEQLQYTLTVGLGAAGEGANTLVVPLRHCDAAPHIELAFEAPPQPWQRNGAELGVWLFETLSEAERVAERDRLAAMGETVAVISHAVKNILQGLQGGAGAIELAIERGDLALAREGWPILARNLDRIHDLTFNMLAWSRTSHLDLRPGSLSALIEDVVALQQPTFEQRRVRLVTAGEPLPDVPFDAAAMHQALLNLVLNALEAAPPRRGEVRIETSVDQQREEAVVAVLDDGPGIPEAEQAAIFEPFASTRGQRGTGLGLAVTRRIAAAHGGRLVLRSAAGDGARFEIRLPLHAAEGDPGDTDIPPPTHVRSEEFEA
jgi:signal transduction histidine kinase